ncbi:MAG: transglutaminase domain-containing protein [Chitinophagales bacterium]
MKKACFTLLLIFIFDPVFSQIQSDSFQKVDSIAQRLSAQETSTISELIEFINIHFSSDNEKSRFIYTWMAIHIRYDVDCYLGKNSNPQDVNTVFRFKQGVCAGYANLFTELCRRCNIICIRVDGTCSKNYTSSHSWNAFKINDAWALADVTWAAGGVTDGNEFAPQFTGQYFRVPPELFIHDHFPDDPMWQLQHQLLTPGDFSAGNFSRIHVSPQETFHFNDTINQFLSLDSLDREEDSFRRSYAFNPGSSYLKEGRISTLMRLADKYLSLGDESFNDYFELKKFAFELPDFFAESEDSTRTLLYTVQTNYNRAVDIYAAIPNSNDANNKAALINNREVINQRLHYLETEKKFIANYFSVPQLNRAMVLKSYPQLLKWKEE